MTKHVNGGNIYTYKHCLDFSANCNPLGTPESVKQAVRDSLESVSYTHLMIAQNCMIRDSLPNSVKQQSENAQ